MFAFVLWDRDTGELLAARDHVGVKPLYYMLKDGLFVAASELRTLIAHPGCDLRSTPKAWWSTSRSDTRRATEPLRDIRKLPPGHLLWLREGESGVQEYWDLLPSEHAGFCRGSSRGDLLDRVGRGSCRVARQRRAGSADALGRPRLIGRRCTGSAPCRRQ